MPPRDWSLLNPHARREYKFVQADSYARVTIHHPHLAGGVCLGVVMNWIQEKLTTSDSWVRAGVCCAVPKRESSRILGAQLRG